MRARRHPPAVPPTNVQLSYADGTVVPVDCRYIGWDDRRRVHVWHVINPRNELPDLIHVDVLPASTSIAIS